MTDGRTETFGPYVVFERLGAGGMATVHRAKKQGIAGFERTVALKRMLPHLSEDPDFVESFIREAKVASMLVHPNIAQTHDFGRQDGTYYIAMEHVDGPDLRKLLRYARRTGQLIPLPVVMQLLGETCDALYYAHTFADEDGVPLDIVHRDISPSNLIVAHTGHLKVIDFGIAKASSAALHTDGGRVKGKYAYMAPEAALGHVLGPVSDVFSLGVVAHELLTLRPLFSATTDLETIMKIREHIITPPSEHNGSVPPGLDDVVMAALARDPNGRLPSAAAFRAMLDEVARYSNVHMSARDVSDWLSAIPPEDGGRMSGRGGMRNSMPSRSHSASQAPMNVSSRSLPLPAPAETAMARRPSATTAPPQTHDDPNAQPAFAGQQRSTAPAMPLLDFSISMGRPSHIPPSGPHPMQPPTPEYTPSSQSLPMPMPTHQSHQSQYPPAAPQPRRKLGAAWLVVPLALAAGVGITYAVMGGGQREVVASAPAETKPAPGAVVAQPIETPPAPAEPATAPPPAKVDEPTVPTIAPDAAAPDEPDPVPTEKTTRAKERDKPRDRSKPRDSSAKRDPDPVVVVDTPDEPAAPPPKPQPQITTPPVKPIAPPVPTPPVQPAKPARTPVVAASAVTKVAGEIPQLTASGGASGSGDVLAKICIDERGSVTEAAIKKAPAGIADELQSAIRKWRYQPYKNSTNQVSAVCFPLSFRIVLKRAD